MPDLFPLARPLLHALTPERAHALTIACLRAGLGPRFYQADDPILRSTVFGLDFANPVGLAAGFDKNAEVVSPMLRLGLGFVEIGSVTPRPQPGNPRPRLFRLPAQDGLIKRLGFHTHGPAEGASRPARPGGGRVRAKPRP